MKPISETAKNFFTYSCTLHCIFLDKALIGIFCLKLFLQNFTSCYVLTLYIVRYGNIRIFTEFWNKLGTCSRRNEVKNILWTGVDNFLNLIIKLSRKYSYHWRRQKLILTPKVTLLQDAELLAFRQLLTQETQNVIISHR